MIDTHVHLILRERFSYAWTEEIPALHGRFGLEDYHALAREAGITAGVFMEVDVPAEQSAEEARFVCALAEDPANRFLGVIASARPENEGFGAYLDTIAHPKLVGIRRILHTQPDALSQSERFRENIRELGKRGLPFDLCLLQRQLGLGLDLVRACPQTHFMLDHCGVPDIANHDSPQREGFRDWEKSIRALAAEPQVFCKISGITVYAREEQRTVDVLHPYVETVLDAFTPARCVWGGDWPVVNLGSGLVRWAEMAREMITTSAGPEAEAIFSENARKFYKLP